MVPSEQAPYTPDGSLHRDGEHSEQIDGDDKDEKDEVEAHSCPRDGSRR